MYVAASPTDSTRLSPTVDRSPLIDSLRAAALCGVIIYNFVAMVGGFLGQEMLAKAGVLDLGSAAIVVVLIHGKARACFALLFGVGFGLLAHRASSRGQNFPGFHLRRMAALLVIGLFNLTFLFFGDILILYAVLGMAMLIFRSWSDSAIVRLGLAFIVAPPLLAGAIEAITGAPLPNLAGLTPAQATALMPSTLGAYQGHDFLAYVAANWRYYLNHYRVETFDTMIYDLAVLGLFLIGLWVARNDVLSNIERWRPFLRKVAWWCLPTGVLLSCVQGSRRMGIPAEGVFHGLVTASFAGIAIAAFGYIALLCLFFTGRGRTMQRLLAPMGRMGLTGYLASNAIGSFTFYGWGLGLITGWSVAGLCLFALATFLGLNLLSQWWLRAFRFGPAEWVWRSLTYGRAQAQRAPTPVGYRCPACRRPLARVRQASESLLSAYQFDADRDGDWICESCPQGGNHRYYWTGELK